MAAGKARTNETQTMTQATKADKTDVPKLLEIIKRRVIQAGVGG